MNSGARAYSVLLAVFGALLVCLLGSAAYSLLRAKEIRHSEDHLARASGPAAAALVNLRAELRRLELLAQAAPLFPKPEGERRLGESRGTLRELLERYLAVSAPPHNQAQRDELRASFQALDRTQPKPRV